MGPERKQSDTKSYAGRFAKRLRELRDQSGGSPQAIADKLGVSLGTYYNWEIGRTFPQPNQLPLLAKALGCQSVGDLFPDR